MPKRKSVDIEGKMQQVFYLNKTVLMKLKAYGLESGTPFLKLIEPITQKLDMMLLEQCEQIDKLRMQEYEAYLREKEARELTEQIPIPVEEVQPQPIVAE